MKFTNFAASLVAMLLIAFTLPTESKAQCNSNLVLDSVVATGGSGFNIYATLCIGAGNNGSVAGGSGDTKAIIFGFYTASGTMVLNNFFPPFIFGDTTLYYLNGTLYGPIPSAPFNGTHQTLAFTGNNFNSFTCTDASPSPDYCGNPHIDCTQFIFTVNEIPDSIRCFGPEAETTYTGPCYPTQSMLINFTNLPVVWAGFEAEAVDNDIELNWATVSEESNERFDVYRSHDGISFLKIGSLPGAGNSVEELNYSFLDTEPFTGENFYKIAQVDFNGNSRFSEVAKVSFISESVISWKGAFPNPTSDRISFELESFQNQALSMEIVDPTKGVVFKNEKEIGTGDFRFAYDATSLAAGMYLVRFRAGDQVIIEKFIKQ